MPIYIVSMCGEFSLELFVCFCMWHIVVWSHAEMHHPSHKGLSAQSTVQCEPSSAACGVT